MTEKALYNFLKDNGFDINKEKNIKYILPFKSENKYMITICDNKDNTYNIYIKGAYEIIKDYITKVRNINFTEENFNQNEKIITEKINEYTNDSKRTIIFTSKKITKEELNKIEKNHIEKNIKFFEEFLHNLTLEIIIGIRDPIREDVPLSIKKCIDAGITVRMITGDNINTALSISKDVGIITNEEKEKAIIIKNQISNLLKIKKTKNEKITENEFENPIALDGNEFRNLIGTISKIYD
jgi:magnesium-transporting ATPase (P-type)